MRKFFPVLAAAAFVMVSSHAFAGTSVKATIVSVNGDPKVIPTCLGGGMKNTDGSCPNAISGSAQVTGKKGVQITLKGMTTPTATDKKQLIDNSATCNPANATAVNCYISTVSAFAQGLPVQVNIPTLIVKGGAKIKLPFSGALVQPAFAGAALQLTGGGTYQEPAPADKPACLAVLTGAAYAGPVSSALIAVAGLVPADLAGIWVDGVAFEAVPQPNPCISGTLIGVAGIYNGN